MDIRLRHQNPQEHLWDDLICNSACLLYLYHCKAGLFTFNKWLAVSYILIDSSGLAVKMFLYHPNQNTVHFSKETQILQIVSAVWRALRLEIELVVPFTFIYFVHLVIFRLKTPSNQRSNFLSAKENWL